MRTHGTERKPDAARQCYSLLPRNSETPEPNTVAHCRSSHSLQLKD